MSYEKYGELFIEQLELEDAFKSIAEDFLKRDIDKRKTDGNASQSSLGKRLMNHSFEDIKANIQLFVNKSLVPKAGVKPEYVEILETLYSIYSDDMDKLYDIMTYIPFSILLDSIFKREFRLSNLCQLIAVDLQTEVKIEKYCKEYPEQEPSLNKGINARVAKHFKLYYTLKRMEYTGYVWNAWNNKTASHLAAKLIEIILSTTDWFEFVTPSTQGKNATIEVQPTQYLLETWYKNEDRMLNHAFKLCPTIIPPDNWVDFRNGGYYGKLKGTSTFLRLGYGESDAIKSTYLNRLNQLELMEVKKAVNTIQATPWKVNGFILSIVKEVVSRGGEIGGIPRMEPLPELARLNPLHTPEELEELKRKAVERIKKENSRKGKAIRCIAHLKIAERFAKYDRIYFPHNMDFRGRIYPIPSFSPQGDDLNKALLLLADPKPITDATSIDWFFIQGANLAGIDKVPYTERIAWINANESKILESAEDPLQNRFWSNQDSPFQFLSFCVEYKRYKKHLDDFGTPIGFKTGLVISFDGSCSGLQHFSAILRDPIGGKAVNLTESDTVQDIYQVVADKVIVKLKEDAQSGTLDDYYIDKETGTPQTDKIKYGTRTLAQQWLTYGITRKVTKRPVMTLAYGAKEYGFNDQIMQDTIEPALLNGTGLMFVAPRQASGYLAKHIWDAVGQTVTKAVEGMAWLQEMSKLVTKSGHVVTWYTPLGLPVQQSYVKCDTDILQLRLCGRLKRIYSFKSTGEIDKKKQASGIAPNFIHSMDATHLMQTVLNSSKQGVTHFAMVHDSYGTTLADAQILYDTVRSTFCDMYTNHDVLANFRKDMEIYIKNPSKIPTVPTKGDLDLNTVKKSLYAFS